jgi:hypothetical protein
VTFLTIIFQQILVKISILSVPAALLRVPVHRGYLFRSSAIVFKPADAFFIGKRDWERPRTRGRSLPRYHSPNLPTQSATSLPNFSALWDFLIFSSHAEGSKA